MSWAFYPVLLKNSVMDLECERLSWHIVPWDSYGDEFISAVSEALDPKPSKCLRVDFSSYIDLSSFMSSVGGIPGLEYGHLVSALNSDPNALLLLDNVSYEQLSCGSTPLDYVVSVVCELLRVTTKTRIIMRSRSVPQTPPLSFIYLGIMDEADSNQFVLAHPLKDNVPASAQATGEIHRLSGGYAGAVDRVLDKLTYTQISDVATESSEMAVKNVDLSKINSSLVGKIAALHRTNEDDLKYLLSVFCVFPYGEDIQHIRNLKQGKPFYPMQSANLVRRGLLDTLKHDFFDRENEELPKVVISSDSANEYIRATNPDLYFELTGRALDLYFGKDWRSGNYKLGKSFSQEILTQFEYSTRNATCLLRRFFKDAVSTEDFRQTQDSLGLINFYTAKLDYKCRYREICELLELLVPLLKELVGWSSARDILFRHATALRMLKNFAEAELIYKFLLQVSEQSNSQLARLNLNLALLYDELDDEVNTVKHAKLVKKGHSKKSTYYHARSIIILRSKSSKQHVQLKALEKKCLSEKHFVAANNIALRVARRFETGETARQTFGRITLGALAEEDLYNHVKACTKYVELLLSTKSEVPEKVLKSLKRCYDYARSQRLETLFRSAHSSLWEILELARDDVLLARLMALSSRAFRLLQDEESERKYLQRIMARKVTSESYLVDRDFDYIEGRINTLNIQSVDSLGSDENDMQVNPGLMG